MKKAVAGLALMLVLAVGIWLGWPLISEMIDARGNTYQVALEQIDVGAQTVGATFTNERGVDENAKMTCKAFETITGEGANRVRSVATVAVVNREPSDAEWSAMNKWLAGVVPEAMASAKTLDAQQVGDAILEAVKETKKDAMLDAEKRVKLWQRDMYLSGLSVQSPYYPDLRPGDRNGDVQALQQKLIELGYLDGAADGQFGGTTEAAIQAVEAELSGRAQQTGNPSAQVNGTADRLLQIRLYSREFPLRDGPLDEGADAAAIARLQKRLIQMGYLIGTADGNYGGNTRRAVRLFQHENRLPLTGIAEEPTQVAVFGHGAKGPEVPLMVKGSAGSNVKKLQQRLILQGFMSGTADGEYGAATVSAVSNLQAYLRAKESAEVPTVEVNGIADSLLMDDFFSDGFGRVDGALRSGAENLDVARMQRRLSQLEYLYASPGGAYGAATEAAVQDFQARNNLPKDGIAGQKTLNLLFSSNARKQLKPYMLKVDTRNQKVYVYGLDENEEHTVLLKTMTASTGLDATPTPKGTYQATTGAGARWHYFTKYKVWGQYAFYIEGNYLFHSILYNQKGGEPNGSQYKLGSKASHGCVRLTVENAKWIYDNCPPQTKVVVV